MSENKGQAETPALFHLIGGQATVDAMVDRFYDRMDALPEARGIRALHAADLGAIREVLKKYFAEWLGGPKRYSSERGHPMLRARHLPFPIGIAERDAWLLCMNGALDETIADAQVREHIRAAITPLADWMRNKKGEAPPGQG
ncbi:MAG: group II truncated hemoglobin [Nevskiaceae bacterium]|jgi:hemoglobin|nr:group II truncated hemoglobin [Nevskiaceae bacterium]